MRSSLRQTVTQLCWLVTAGMLVGACSADPPATDPPPSGPLVHVYRVADSDSLRLYIFEPAVPRPTSPRSAVLLFHGGGWSAGEPEWTFDSAHKFANEGLVAVSVEYRLSGAEWTPLDALTDVCESLRWVRRHAGELGIDPMRIAGHGVSAGGHLIASTATVGCPNATGAERSTPDLLLLWSPALDVTTDGWFARQLKGQVDPAAVSPAQHVHPNTPATSIVMGDSDTLTPLAGAKLYCNALEAASVRCELNVYAGLGHLLTRDLANQESDFDPDPEARADGTAKHLQFLRSNGF